MSAPRLVGERRRQALFRLLALIGGPVLFFALAELILLLSGSGHDARFFVSVPGRAALCTNPTFGWRFFPPQQARHPLPQEIVQPKPPDSTRIVVLGGSAAMGIPDPAFSFGRFLGVMLEKAGAGDTEIIDAGMTAVNSHVVREIAGQLDELEPDAVIIYMGNNEVVGPFGLSHQGSHRASSSLFAIRATSTLLRTRTGQLISRLLAPKRGGGWRGMTSFAEHRIAAPDARLERIYGHFAQNLRDIIERARDSGAEVLVSSVAVDIRATPPFASLVDENLSEARRSELESALIRTAELLERGRVQAALGSAEAAVAIAPGHAEAHYLLGQAEARLGQSDPARASLERARDLDALRFRADSVINETIRRIATEEDAILVDSALHFDHLEGLGQRNEEFFFEHVHFTADGAYQLARAVFSAWHRTEPAASLEECLGILGFTEWHRLGQIQDIAAMMARPPFTYQLAAEARQAEMRSDIRRLESRLASAESFQRVKEVLVRALEQRPTDIPLRRSLADLLISAGEGEIALEHLRPLLARLPQAPGLWLDAGNAAVAAEAFEEAEEFYRRAGELDPYSPDVPFNQGALSVRRARFTEAVGRFEASLSIDPGHLEARLNLAAALDRLGHAEQALETYSQAVEMAPDEPVAIHQLAAALEKSGAHRQAAELLATAVERFPADGVTHFQWARRLSDQGRRQSAIRHYALALRYEPELSEARSGLVELHNHQASELATAGDIDAAITALRKALAADPDHAASHFNLALVLGRRGRLEDAIEHLQRAYSEARSAGLGTLETEAESRLRALGLSPVERTAEN